MHTCSNFCCCRPAGAASFQRPSLRGGVLPPQLLFWCQHHREDLLQQLPLGFSSLTFIHMPTAGSESLAEWDWAKRAAAPRLHTLTLLCFIKFKWWKRWAPFSSVCLPHDKSPENLFLYNIKHSLNSSPDQIRSVSFGITSILEIQHLRFMFIANTGNGVLFK